jgi:hypothetical protein
MPDDKAKPESGSTETEVRATHVRPANLPAVYVNGANVAMGQFEIRLYVSEVAPIAGQEGVSITDKVCLIMSPEFTDALAKQLTDIILNYENSFGKLRHVTTVNTKPETSVLTPPS